MYKLTSSSFELLLFCRNGSFDALHSKFNNFLFVYGLGHQETNEPKDRLFRSLLLQRRLLHFLQRQTPDLETVPFSIHRLNPIKFTRRPRKIQNLALFFLRALHGQVLLEISLINLRHRHSACSLLCVIHRGQLIFDFP